MTHIGFLDFTLFKDHPEFYATYRMVNVKNRQVYNDKFTLSVVDLSQVNPDHVIQDLKQKNAQKDAALEYSRYIAKLFREGQTDGEITAALMKRFAFSEEQAAEKLALL